MKKTVKPSSRGRDAVLTLVLAAVLAVAVIAGSFLGPFMDLDVSEKNIYGISDISRDFVSTVDKKIQMFVIGDEPDARIVKFVSKYCGMSDMLEYSVVSPAQNPEIVERYGAEEDTVVVSCPESGRNKIIRFSDIVEFDTLAYAYYGQYIETVFDGDSELTNALGYVLSSASRMAVFTQGHREADPPVSVAKEMVKQQYSVALTDIIADGGIPQNCNIVIMNAPASDMAADEAETLRQFVENGGNLVILMDSELTVDYTRISQLLEEYGIGLGGSVVSDPSSCYQNEYLIFPLYGTRTDITRYLTGDQKSLIFKARDLLVEEQDFDGKSVRILLTTTPGGVATDVFGNVTGPDTTVLGAVSAREEGGSVIVLPASLIKNTTVENYGNLANTEIFMNALAYGSEDTLAFTVPCVSLADTHNAVPAGSPYGAIFVAIIPVLLLVVGAVICLRRRRA